MTPKYASLAFNLPPTKAREITYFFFENHMEHMVQEVEIVCQKIKKDRRFYRFSYKGLEYQNIEMFRPWDVPEAYGFSFYHPKLQDDECQKLADQYKKLLEDMKFFSQWLSIVLKSSTLEEYSQTSMNKLPPILYSYLCEKSYKFKEFKYKYKYKIPKGKEELWDKITQLIQFYIGMELLI